MATLTSRQMGPTATAKQAGAAAILSLMAFLFFSIAIGAAVAQRLAVPPADPQTVAQLQAFAPAAVAIAVGHVVVAMLAASVWQVARWIAASATAVAALAFAVGAVAIAAGWSMFPGSGLASQLGVEAAAAFVLLALIYAGIAWLVARPHGA